MAIPTHANGGPQPATPLAIEATGLAKSFGETRAVDGVDLAVRTGSVYGVLGPNGAGKTTTIRMLATLLRPDAGSARIFGYDVVREYWIGQESVTLAILVIYALAAYGGGRVNSIDNG